MSFRTGLLYRAQNLSKYDFSFISFLKRYNVDCIFELKYYSYYYFCSKSYGLDSDSIIQTNSTKAFWDGLITKDNEIFNFSKVDNSIAPFLQFFSFELKDCIDSLSVYKYDEETILVLCNHQLSKEIVDAYISAKAESENNLNEIQSQLNDNSIPTLFSVDFSESVENLGEEKLKNNENLRIEYEKVLFNELYTRLQFYFSQPSAIVRTSKSAANILFISKSNISQDLIVYQLIKLFSKVIGASAELISFNFLGQTRSITEIKEFLKVN